MAERMRPVYCTECGEMIENKFFSLTSLLKDKGYDEVAGLLDVGALYGGPVLPAVLPLIVEKRDGTEAIQRPKEDKTALEAFRRTGRGLLSISAIVAQFSRMANFPEFYRMLEIELDLQGGLEAEDAQARTAELRDLCEPFARLSSVRMEAVNLAAIRNLLASIIASARSESACVLDYAWRAELINGVPMPAGLDITDGKSKKKYALTVCCCDKCHRPVLKELGAYEQVIVGVLGTQAVGKTSYLMALADTVKENELTTMKMGNEVERKTRFLMEALVEDPQWKRVQAEKSGGLWLYQKGYPVVKTAVGELEAPALTWLVKDVENVREPVMYTLADIPGEAFSEPQAHDPEVVHKVTRLLRNSEAVIVVVNSLQTSSEWAKKPEYAAARADVAAGADKILACFDKIELKKGLPTAVVMTASDLIDEGDLRRAFHLPYDIKKLPPLRAQGEAGYLSYNRELMQGASRGVWNHLNTYFSGFMSKLTGHAAEELAAGANPEEYQAAFAVSNGTQCAKWNYGEKTDNTEEERYGEMKSKRFGVAAPLLWILDRKGVL